MPQQTTFDDAFQEQVAAHYLRDDAFVHSVGSLIEPDYFENETLAGIIAAQKIYWAKYQSCPTLKTFVQVLEKLQAAKRVKIADRTELRRLLGVLYKDPLKDRQFVIDTAAEFAREQAIANATLELVDALDGGVPDNVQKALDALKEAETVGAADARTGKRFNATLDDRLDRRARRAAGTLTNGGITTGIKELDQELTPHRGWGRKELAVLMGPAKSGKSAALITFGINAARAGHNVLYVSKELGDTVLEDRMDANISGVPLKQLDTSGPAVEKALKAYYAGKPGEFVYEAFPSGTFKVSELVRLLKKFQAEGLAFDLVIVDYADIMKPERSRNDKREELNQIYVDLRAVADVFDLAMLTATQTNREGTKKASRNVTDSTDVAEDYNKVRTADAFITINASEDDKLNGEVVLYFSDMRNAESGLRLRFSQDIRCMRFITGFIGRDY